MSSSTTFPKFEVDIKDLWTTREEEANVAKFERWYKNLKTRSAAREIAAKSKSFRFLDLPPELRNRVYAFAFQNMKNFGKRQNLALVALPTITRVSRQIRQETLPLFFATTHFRLVVASDFNNRFDPDAEYKSTIEIQNAGTTHIKQKVKKTLRLAGNKALIRNINLVVCDARDWRRSGQGQGNWGGYDGLFTAFSAEIRLGQGNLVVNMSRGMGARDWAELSDTIDDVMADTKAAIENVAGKENFQGFSLRDLEQIVKTLRCYQKS
ncbi:uncharacterized protein MYCFIDRAFT_196169 [Pseudocercospora fijiensis CIRAD86]|uniref:F-box domain-containing protein n=1 Tax=Pseudocercospora fijiensis (strain CIRAD86) TaxID=383855 RepID=M2YYE9_PSEFD|nr:uncharacterized protein MYCFIDRAFT_196169 [Pseudocercospora fijiensis CIRAD86]EME82665.1 hypothetical protein MYCFIDRAFT_196169 [Pseudocercospora fijiensis CIRAD86]